MKIKRIRFPNGFDHEQKPVYVEVEDIDLSASEFVETLKTLEVITRR